MQTAKGELHEVMSAHLMTLMRLAKYKWLSVLSSHAAVLNGIELERFNITESDRFKRGARASQIFARPIEYFFSQSRNEGVKKQRDPKPHINNDNTVTFH